MGYDEEGWDVLGDMGEMNIFLAKIVIGGRG